jgi:hypothetical protein
MPVACWRSDITRAAVLTAGKAGKMEPIFTMTHGKVTGRNRMRAILLTGDAAGLESRMSG